MNTTISRTLARSVPPGVSDDILRMIVANVCPKTLIRRICSLVEDYRDGLRAYFVAHDECAAQGTPQSARQIPVRDAQDSILGTLHIDALDDAEDIEIGLDCHVIQHVIHLLQIALTRSRDQAYAYRERERAMVALQRSSDGIITTDDNGIIDYINPIAGELLCTSLSQTIGRDATKVLSFVDRETGASLENPVADCLRSARAALLGDNVALACCDGKSVPVHGSAAPLRDENGRVIGTVLIFGDVSGFSRVARQLAYQITHDPLTGLVNRREFEKHVLRCIETRKNLDRSCAVLQIDIDQLKVINDTYGHMVGDELLRRLSEKIRECLEDQDTLARLNGDEFGVLLCDRSGESVLATAEAIRAAVEAYRFSWRGAVASVRCSIGAVVIEDDNADVSRLLAAADFACYAAKDSGRNQVSVYSDFGQAGHHEEMRWVSRIRQAIDEQRFELYFQPIVDIQNGGDSPKHYEVLLRLRDESGDLVPPSFFIPAAERYNLMPQLDRWAISTVLANHIDRGKKKASCMFAINISGKSLCDHRFLEFVIGELERHDLPEKAICFEITETAAIADLARAVFFIKTLRRMGCIFALDDFGSGLSSFTYLKRMPVQVLKIDGHFVHDMLSDEFDICTVEAICKVARTVGIRTVAEKVESQAVLEKLRELGVDSAQGYHIALPAPMCEFDPDRRYI